MSRDPYQSAQYQRLRPLILERDGWQCQLRLPGCRVTATTVDHRVPISAGGGHAPENLQAACRHCQDSQGGLITQAKRRGQVVGRRSRRW